MCQVPDVNATEFKQRQPIVFSDGWQPNRQGRPGMTTRQTARNRLRCDAVISQTNRTTDWAKMQRMQRQAARMGDSHHPGGYPPPYWVLPEGGPPPSAGLAPRDIYTQATQFPGRDGSTPRVPTDPPRDGG